MINDISEQSNIGGKENEQQFLSLPCIGSPTAYGNKYTTIMDYRTLNDEKLHLFSNRTAQRTVKDKRAQKIAKDYFNTLTKDNEETHEVPFQSSFVVNLNLQDHGFSEEDIVSEDGKTIKIPIAENILSIRDGGHRKVASHYLIKMLESKIEKVNSRPSKKAYYQYALQKFLNVNFTVDIYIDLGDKYSKRCLLDLGKSEPVASGREFYFIHDEYADAIEFLSNKPNDEVRIDLDNNIYSKYNGLAVPLHYVSDIIKVLGDALYKQDKFTEKEVNEYIIKFMTDLFATLTIDTFSFKDNQRTGQLNYLTDCKMNFFKAVKRQLTQELKEVKAKAIKKVVGVDILYSKLASKPKREVIETISEIDLISKFNFIKEIVTTNDFKADVFAK
ncbi:hypothetical protein ACSVDA_11005 [Cytobacillus sp. Hm23]